jgi:hypothetical protein
VRSHPARFFVVPGHEDLTAGEVVVEQHGRFTVVEKQGEERELVERVTHTGLVARCHAILERNEALFKEVNERIQDVSTTLAPDDVPLEFLCECDDPDCVGKVSATRAEYEAIRSVATQFVVLAGHEDPGVEHVVQQTNRFLVVEKEGEAAHEAQEDDPRKT